MYNCVNPRDSLLSVCHDLASSCKINLYVYPFDCPSVRLSVCLCVCASVRPCVLASVRPCVRASVRPFCPDFTLVLCLLGVLFFSEQRVLQPTANVSIDRLCLAHYEQLQNLFGLEDKTTTTMMTNVFHCLESLSQVCTF